MKGTTEVVRNRYPQLEQNSRCTCGGRVYEIDSKRRVGFCPGHKTHPEGKLWQL